MTGFDPPPIIRPPIWGVRVEIGVENSINQNLVPTFLSDFYTNYGPILHRFATIHNAADDRQMTDDRQADRAIGKGGRML